MTALHLATSLSRPKRGLAVDPGRRGSFVIYRRGEVNWCPGCGRRNWWIGRLSAECAFCSTAIDLERP